MEKGNYNIIRRLPIIHNAIASGKYPNKNTLIKIISEEFRDKELSVSTIGNDIEFLRTEYNAPIEFDFTRNGYYYANKNFVFDLFNPNRTKQIEEMAKVLEIEAANIKKIEKCTDLGLSDESKFEYHPEIKECGRYFFDRNIWIGLKKLELVSKTKLSIAIYEEYTYEKKSTQLLQNNHLTYIAEDWPSEGGYWLYYFFNDDLLNKSESNIKFEFMRLIKYIQPEEG